MRKSFPAKPTVRFRRWSRKAYAVFASLKNSVTIGCLRSGTADSSLSKQKRKDKKEKSTSGTERINVPVTDDPGGCAETAYTDTLLLKSLFPAYKKVQVSFPASSGHPDFRNLLYTLKEKHLSFVQTVLLFFYFNE